MRPLLDLAAPVVDTVAAMTLGVAADKSAYQANEAVAINATVANVSGTSMSGQVLLAIRAAGSNTDIAELPPVAVTNLAPGGQQIYPAQWNTANTLAGSYVIYGRLLDAQGRVVAESTVPFAIVAPQSTAATHITTDKLVYEAWDTVTLDGRVQNVAANAILPPSRMEISVRAPSGTVVFSDTRLLGELTPGALRDLAFTVPLNDAASGTYPVELVLEDEFTRIVLSTSTTSFQVNHRDIQALTGTVGVQSARVYRGDPDICTESAKNISGTNLTGVKLIHQLINVDGGLVFDETTETVDIPAGGSVHDYVRHVDTGPLGLGGFACVLKAELNGETRTLAFAGFQVIEPPIRIDASLSVGTKGRLLVLLDRRDQDCDVHSEDPGKHDGEISNSHDNRSVPTVPGDDRDADKGCNADRDPHGPKGAPALSAQRSFLEGLLTAAGWSYTITDNAADFSRELRTGGYSTYALFSEQAKLDDATQKELREAVFRGEGLVLAGTHDNRNEKLNDALGLKRIGAVAHATAVDIPAGPLNVTGSLALIPGDKIDRVKLITANSLATYQLDGPSRSGDSDCRDDGNAQDGSGDPHDGNAEHGPDKDCDRAPDRYIDAITLNTYGFGKALFAGFDLLAQATRDGTGSDAANALLAGLGLTQPIPKATLGGVIPIVVTLQNRGIATVATARIDLPNGTRVVDAGGGQVQSTQTGQTVTFTADLAVGQAKSFTFYLQLPHSEASLTLEAVVTAAVGTTSRTVADTSLVLTVEPIATLDRLLATARALAPSLPRRTARAVQAAIRDIERANRARTLEIAIFDALEATDRLLGIDNAEVKNLRRGLDEWLRYNLMSLNSEETGRGHRNE